MKVLVTGKHGQIARSVAERILGSPRFEIIFAARPQVDLSIPGSLADAVASAKPDIVINAAAFTHVDQAEDQAPLARRINMEAAGEGAQASAKLGIPFLHFSTDYVFDGSGDRPWREDDVASPLNIYGQTKADGETRVLDAGPLNLVVRTSWLFGPFGRNFVKTILTLAARREEIPVVADQRGCPTNTLELVGPLMSLAERAVDGGAGGIWHLAGQGTASWADLARHVVEASAAQGGPSVLIRSISTDQYPTPAKRPLNSSLDCNKIRDRFGIVLPEWRHGIDVLVERLVAGT